jgi:hypothetical protein
MAQKEMRQVILDAGTRRKRDIRRLEEGGGPLQSEVDSAIGVMKTQVPQAAGAAAREIIPVVLVLEQRRKKQRSRGGLLSILLGE